ncbi:MAG: acetyl-CoA decarbonylase/synthase complex subunit gamma [Dissulfurimicrobium sp.]|uniref:acetyl-CoA decarbonylase/synthase complex subunit gamma n=1 Tax=Dissulfurimicrobium sp. TaxID=2022436 RepID=UPI004049F20B
MALTGIQILKMLPKKNCGECGVPTCLAFAMKVAAGQSEIGACPYVSEEVKEKVGEASAPPIRTIILGNKEAGFKMGGEICIYRHEKRFENPTGIAVLIKTDMPDSEIAGRLERFNTLKYERVGLELKADIIAVKDAGQGETAFVSLVERVRTQCPQAALVLMSGDPAVLTAGARAAGDSKPLLYCATAGNIDAMADVARQTGAPLAIRGETIGEASALADKLLNAGLKDLVIDTGARTMKAVFEDHVAMRRASIKHKFKPLGFPSIAFPCEITEDPMLEPLVASILIAKYAGIVVLSDLNGESLFPLLLERLNLYTDPQRPMVVQEDIYPINGPGEDSPVLITCNFSLTYFIVSGEIEGSKVPSWLLIKDTEGLSVLTAWAAGKFSADLIAGFVKKSGITDKVRHRNLIIPGYLASIKGELEEELQGWNIQIGPREASHLPTFLREWRPA